MMEVFLLVTQNIWSPGRLWRAPFRGARIIWARETLVRICSSSYPLP